MLTPISNVLGTTDTGAAERLTALADEWPSPAIDPDLLSARFAHLLALGLDQIGLPAQGQTLQRWQTLSRVASLDLGLAKLFESHTDARAILAEISPSRHYPTSTRWAVWAAEPPSARLTLAPRTLAPSAAETPASGSAVLAPAELAPAALAPGATEPMADGHGVVLNGTKAWCSGAHAVTHALVTAWHDHTPYLAAVDLAQPGIRRTQSGWSAVGMGATASVEVTFEDAEATLIGGANSYLQRPGFWHGGIGIAACWWGGAVRIGDILLARKGSEDPHRLAHLGMVDVVLCNGASRLRDAAAWIDRHPEADAQHLALSVRAAVDDMVSSVIAHAGRALGAGPYCRDEAFARMMADLPVFVRQAHAERDLESIGASLQARANDQADPGKTPAPHGWSLTT